VTFLKDARGAQAAQLKAMKIFEENGFQPVFVDEKEYDIVLNDGRKVEVKHDTWIARTGNIAYEWWSDKEKQNPGWGQYVDADILVYYFNFDCAYVLDMKALKEFVVSNFDRFVQKGARLSKALNLMVHITHVEEFRMRELEEHFHDAWYDDKYEQAGPLEKD